MEAVPTAMNEAKSMRRVQTSTCYKREDAQRCTIIIISVNSHAQYHYDAQGVPTFATFKFRDKMAKIVEEVQGGCHVQYVICMADQRSMLRVLID